MHNSFSRHYTILRMPLAGSPTCVTSSMTHTVFWYSGRYRAPVYAATAAGEPW